MHSRTTPPRMQRCVVWVPPEGAAPTRLLVGLSQRQVATVVMTDAPSVMQQLAQGPIAALIVVEPTCQPHLNELVTAVQTYYPRMMMWQYRALPTTEGGGLTRLNTQPPAANKTAPKTTPMAQPISSDMNVEADTSDRTKHQRLRGDRDTDASPPDQAEQHASHGRFTETQRAPLITPEELDMLLGPAEKLEQEPPRS